MTITSLDARSLLRRIDPRIAALRRLLTHDHGDEAFWAQHPENPRDAQAERAILRVVANLLHVERATQRGRIHGTRFATLDEQREWLATFEHRMCATAAYYAGLPDSATLAKLRIGELLDLPRPTGTP